LRNRFAAPFKKTQLSQSSVMAIPCSVLVLASLLFAADALGGLRNRDALVATTATQHTIPNTYAFKARCGTNSQCFDMSSAESGCPTCSFRCNAFAANMCGSQLAACNSAQRLASGSETSYSTKDCDIAECMNTCPCSSSTKGQLTYYFVGSAKTCHANCLLAYGDQIFPGQKRHPTQPNPGRVNSVNDVTTGGSNTPATGKPTNQYHKTWAGSESHHTSLANNVGVKGKLLAKCLADKMRDPSGKLFLAEYSSLFNR